MARDVRYYTDEHSANAIADALRRRDVDVLTTYEAGMLGASDEEQLAFATKEDRVLFTQVDDFLRLHAARKEHAGIAYAPQGKLLGDIVRGLILLYEVLDMRVQGIAKIVACGGEGGVDAAAGRFHDPVVVTVDEINVVAAIPDHMVA